MTTAEVLSVVERAFPFVPRPAEDDLPAHTDGCPHCVMTTRYLTEYTGPNLPAEAIRWLCDEMSTISPAATAWVFPSYLRYVLTAEDPRDPRPTAFLIYNLAPAPEHAADIQGRLSVLTAAQVEALLTVVRHLADTPYWADHYGGELEQATAFLEGLSASTPDHPETLTISRPNLLNECENP